MKTAGYRKKKNQGQRSKLLNLELKMPLRILNYQPLITVLTRYVLSRTKTITQLCSEYKS